MSKTVYIKTYGCGMNQYDSDRMLDALKQQNITPITTPETADVLILNTCSVREKAENKVYSELGRWAKLKHKNPHLIIGVTGCVASQEGKTIIQKAPQVDLVLGPQTIHKIATTIQSIANKKLSSDTKKSEKIVDIEFAAVDKFDNLPTPSNTNKVSAYLTIMEGCSKYCGFCIVPFTRGDEISRSFDEVIDEAVTLANQGIVEINLLGQNVNAYRGKQHNGNIADLALLIQYIAAIPKIKRIRFTTSHPAEFSDNLVQAYKNIPKLANHLHLPVQSGSNNILAAMKRGYTSKQYINKISKLRQVRPGISISSDFIVGFPGETNDDFMQTLDLVQTIGFDNSFSFVYSKRPGTLSAEISDNTTAAEKKRLWLLQNRLTQQANHISQSMLGTTQQVLVTEYSNNKNNAEKLLTGRTDNNRIVHFKADPEQIGKILDIKITQILANSLRGVTI